MRNGGPDLNILRVFAAMALSCAIAGFACSPAASHPDDGDWIAAVWYPHQHEVRDRGRGVVFPSPAGDRTAPPRTDTLRFRASPDSAGPVTAMLLVEYDTTGGWRHVLLSRQPVEPNLLEYGYEEAGVPIDSVAAGGWLRALLGVREDGTVLTGWTSLRPGTDHHLWSEHLPTQMLFLPASFEGSYHDAPEGPRTDPPPDLDDVSLHVMNVQPPWVQIRFVSPADQCVAEDERPRTETIRWVRYLDDRGRPLLWYYTRGC